MAPKKTKAAAAPAKAAPKVANPLFPARKKNFRIGGDVRVRCYPGAL
jgi:chromosome condensin MukBEF MukE localization factor